MQGVEQADRRIGGGAAYVAEAAARRAFAFSRLSLVDRAVARAVLHRDIGEHAARPGPRTDAVVDLVAERIDGCPGPLRMGIRGASLVLAVLLLRVDRADPAASARALAPLFRRPLPVVGDYLRLVRALVLAGWYDHGEGEQP